VHTFPTPTPPRLDLDIRAGSLAIDTADVAETTVEIRPLDDSNATLDALVDTTVVQRGDDIVVHVPGRHGVFGRSAKLAILVSAPHGSALAIRTGSADVVARGRFGTSVVATGSGDVTLGEITDSLRVTSGSGAVRVESVAGDVTAKSGSGDLDIVDVGGDVSAQSGSGDIVVGGAGRGLVAKTGSGDIVVGAAPADVSVTTASGDIRIDVAAEGEVRARAASGDIHAGVPHGTAAWLEVRTVSGRVRSALDAAGAPAGDDRRVRLGLSTVSGDIELVRA
jgi:DUF4097 and DUF4098 domain-containing protein YvlB